MANKDYVKIAQKSITRPSESAKRPRYLIYSRNKKGKTGFCLTANDIKGEKILIVDPEHGTDRYKKRNPDVWHLTKWEQLQDIWGFLRTGKHDYTWVALDGMTKINNLALRYIMRKREEANLEQRPGIVDRRDYNKSGELIKELIHQFDALPLGVIYTAQERIINVEETDDETNEESTFFVPDLPQGARGTVNSIVDVIGRLYVVKAQFKDPANPKGEPITKNQRRLWIDVHTQYDTGFRSEYNLPEMVKNPTVGKLTKLLEEGVAA